MKIKISDIPADKTYKDYPNGTQFIFDEDFPRYILEPFEVVWPKDPRYKTALSCKEVLEIVRKE